MKYSGEFEAIWQEVQPYTMTSKNRGFALYEAVNYIVENQIPGYFVECGVWRGGSSMIIAKTLLLKGETNRAIYLFDTFEGMTPPSEADSDLFDVPASETLAKEKPDGLTHAVCDLESVRSNMISTGYPRKKFGYVKGDVRETLPFDGISKIALLRLDTDFKDSTEAELKHLYPKVADGGVVIIDDYGHWQGARAAVDEFLDQDKANGIKHFLSPLDYTGRSFVKPCPPDQRVEKDTPRRVDYISPTMKDPQLLNTFTHLVQVAPETVSWQYLRSEVPHIWRNDTRAAKKNIGVLSVDEGAVLFAAAKAFKNKRGLEIGCHLAFSTAHLAKSGLVLDVIDPALGNSEHMRAVEETLQRSVPDAQVRLHAGFSPNLVETVHRAGGSEPWSFAFIDGLHDHPAPIEDAKAVEPFMAETAAIMFHDLTSPDVAAGLRFLSDSGWKCRIFETMQVMGLAWRGDYQPPEHIPDPLARIENLDHLKSWLVPAARR